MQIEIEEQEKNALEKLSVVRKQVRVIESLCFVFN
jgi:hypothetical protein